MSSAIEPDREPGRGAPPEARSGAPAERSFEAVELVTGANANRGLLAIDTALGTSAAFGRAGRVFEVSSDDPRGHSENVGRLIARALELAGAAPEDVTEVVVGVGPGPFTGLRVGIAAAHAFALGRGAPVLPLQGHEAVALAVLEPAAAAQVCVVQDARRRELFVSEFSGLDWRGVPVRTADPHLLVRADHIATDADVWPSRIPAARLVQLAARRLATAGVRGSDRGFEPDAPLYLRAPDVLAPRAPKRVTP